MHSCFFPGDGSRDKHCWNMLERWYNSKICILFSEKGCGKINVNPNPNPRYCSDAAVIYNRGIGHVRTIGLHVLSHRMFDYSLHYHYIYRESSVNLFFIDFVLSVSLFFYGLIYILYVLVQFDGLWNLKFEIPFSAWTPWYGRDKCKDPFIFNMSIFTYSQWNLHSLIKKISKCCFSFFHLTGSHWGTDNKTNRTNLGT